MASREPARPGISETGGDAGLIDSIARTNAEAISTVPGLARRPQHPKHHGCVRARFIIGEVPEDLRHGLFALPGTYDALVRFSNGRQLDDRKRDAHGMAIKVLGIDREWLSAENPDGRVQDFILVDHETFFTGDLGDYDDINTLLLKRGLARLKPLSRLLFTGFYLFGRIRAFVSHRPVSPLASRYFSTTPYRLGDLLVKYTATPRPVPVDPPEVRSGRDQLAVALRETLIRCPVTFEFGVDVQIDPAAQPVDDPSIAWSAVPGARHEKLATLEIFQQDVDQHAPLAENIAFSPWNSLPAHEPVGAINLARRQAYESAARKRHEVNGVVPPVFAGIPESYKMQQPSVSPRNDGMPLWLAIVAALLLIACLVLEGKRLTIKPGPPQTFDNPVAEFKYGSIGAEWDGFPYMVWRELPAIFKDELPEGWRTFGFIEEPGQELPIGFSIRRVGVPRVGFNCATCHSVEVTAGGNTMLLLGAPAEKLDIQSYILFLGYVAASDKLTADAVIESAAQAGRPLGPIDRLLVRTILVPGIKDQADGLATAFSWMKVKPQHGPGRTDAGNNWRARWGYGPEKDEAVGTVDFPSVWNQGIREGGWFHWDGNNNSLIERNYSAALAGGAKEWLLQRGLIDAQAEWLRDLPPPAYPLPVNADMAADGAAIYEREGCGTCHDPGGESFGQVTPLSDLQTDPARSDLFDEAFVSRFGDVGKGYTWRFSHYRATDGYANTPLDAIWARGPYLHNGSVPTLRALLSPPEDRPATFYRGCTDFDPVDVGFACESGFLFDTQLTGNGNGGHLYGTGLPDGEKSALIEYLKSKQYAGRS